MKKAMELGLPFAPLDQVALDGHDNDIVFHVVNVDVDVDSIYPTLKNSPSYTLLAPNGDMRHNIKAQQMKLIRHTEAKSKYDSLAMYVIVKNTAPIGLGINACTHAGYLAGRKFSGQDFEDWEKYSFRQRTCLVSPEEFDECIRASEETGGAYVIFNENDWNDQDLSAAFSPRYSFPPIFKKLKLHPGFVEKR
jgi:hypothetical protein